MPSDRFPSTFLGPDPRFENPRRLTPAEGLERFRRAQRERDRDAIAIGNLLASSPGWDERLLRAERSMASRRTT